MRGERRTSPSHLFLPLRQFVQARAPRFGMWEGGTGGAPWPAGDSCGDAISDRLPWPLLKLVVRRRFPLGWSS